VAAKKGNGHDRVTQEMVEILRKIQAGQEGNTHALNQIAGGVRTLHEEQRKTNERLDTLTVRVDVLTMRVDTLAGDVHSLTKRVDTLTEDMHTMTEDVHAMRADLSSLDKNVGSIRTEALADVRQYDERIRRLEAAVFKPAAE
jgi:chromosome segregation ATPase